MSLLAQEDILQTLNRALGQSGKIRKLADAKYFCPKCNHYKRKLEINLMTQQYHCWVCGLSGNSFTTLFKKLGLNISNFNLPQFSKVKSTTYSQSSLDNLFSNKEEEHPPQNLPFEYIPLSDVSKSFEYMAAIKYLKSRQLTHEDVYKYNMGYCLEGPYKNRIIVPSYDSYGNLNFFTGRDFYNTSTLKYLNCDFSKDIIGFEMFVNFNEPIVLIEGSFDAIAIRRNAIPLYGKSLSSKLKEKLITTKVPMVIVMLDNDAVKDSIRICEFLLKNGICTKLILPDSKDASVLGFKKTWQMIDECEILTFDSLIKLKLTHENTPIVDFTV